MKSAKFKPVVAQQAYSRYFGNQEEPALEILEQKPSRAIKSSYDIDRRKREQKERREDYDDV